MRPFINRRNISIGIVATVVAACGETVTSPAATDGVTTLSATSFAKGVDAGARVLRSSSGVSALEVVVGDFSTLAPDGTVVPGATVGVLKKVHVKFCKDYKSLGLSQFSANFTYKPPTSKDTDKDTDSDKRKETDGKVHQVNWDRSTKFTALDGSGYAKMFFTGIPEGALLEVQVKYEKTVTKPDGKVETKSYEEKFCVEAEGTPQLSLLRVEGTQLGTTGLTADYRALINVSRGANAVALAQCTVTVDGVVVGTTPAVAVSREVGAWCSKTLTFPTVGVHNVVFSLASGAAPGGPDVDPANNTKTLPVTIGGNGGGSGGNGGSGGSGGSGGNGGPGPIVFELNPNIVETMDSTVVSDSAIYSATNRQLLGSETTITFDQSSRINGVIKRVFNGPVRLILKQTTVGADGTYIINTVDYTVAGGSMCTPLTVLSPRAYDVTFCPNQATNETILSYRTRGTASYRTATGYFAETGLFRSYGTSITYDLTLEYQGYRYHLDKSATEPNITVGISVQEQRPWGTGTKTCTNKVGYELCNSSFELIRTKNSLAFPVQLLVTPTQIP